MSAVLVIDGLEKSYGSMRALRGVSLQVAAGEVMGLLGHNVAGKTTLVSIVAGLRRAHAGSVVVDGVDAVRDPVRAARRLGMAPQDLGCVPVGDRGGEPAVLSGLAGLRGAALGSSAERARPTCPGCAPESGHEGSRPRRLPSDSEVMMVSSNVQTRQGSGEVGERLQALVNRTVDKRRIAHAILGAAAGDGSARWITAAGDARPGEPMRPGTPFFVASVTKRFIATLVLQAHEGGELALDDPITARLPAALTDGLHVHKGVDHTPAITVHHLLTHTSGLPDYFDKPRTGPSLYQQLVGGQDRSWTLADVARMTREEHRPHFPPQDLTARGQKARYSDTGFQLLIAIVEAATGRSFADLLHERIFDRVGMDHSWLPGRSKPLADAGDPAMIHLGRRQLDLPKLIESSNDLISTAEDLLRFQQALVGGELFDQPATVGMLADRANLLRNMPPNRYSTGTWIFPVNRLVAPGRKPLTLIGHAGVTGTWLFTCPELDVHLVGSVDQANGQRMPFRIMLQMLHAWHR